MSVNQVTISKKKTKIYLRFEERVKIIKINQTIMADRERYKKEKSI